MFRRVKAKTSEMTSKLFFSMLILNMLMKFSSSIIAVIDTAVTGRFLGSVAVAASGFASAYFFLITLVGRWLSTGCQSLCSGELGKGNIEKSNSIFSITFYVTLVSAVIIAAGGFLCTNGFACFIGADPSSDKLFELIVAYLKGLFPGAPFYILSMILIPMLQLDGDMNRVRLSTYMLTGFDIAGDLINVLVIHGGMFGMGLTTSISQAVQFLVLFSHFLSRENTLRISRADLRLADLREVLKIGSSQAFNSYGLILMSLFLNRYTYSLGGDNAMAALAVMRNAGGVLGIYGTGIFGTNLILGKICYSETNRKMLYDVEHLSLYAILSGCGLLAIIGFLGAPLIASLYLNSSESAYEMTVTAIRIYSLSLPFQARVSQEGAMLLAFEYVMYSSLVNIASTLIFPVIFCALLGHLLGTVGVWWSFPVSYAALHLVLLVITGRKNGIREKYQARLNDPDFHVMDLDIKSIQDISEISDRINSFCIDNGISRKRAFHTSLCFTELAENVLQHGFDPSKNNHLEARLIIYKDELTLRLRDDCHPFDFKKQMDEWKEDKEHPEKKIGIRIVRGIAKDVSYTGVFKTNNLIITF